MAKKDWKVLFIDDEEGIRRVMSIALADAGYEVLTAADGESGLALCDEKSPHIVITDIRMPGIDGIEVLRRIKETQPDKEVIVVTAFGEMELAVRALQLDASDFITKPINDEALGVALKRAEDRYTTRKELQDYTALIEEKWLETAKELTKTYNFQKNLIESSIQGIIGCDSAGEVITYNRSMEKTLGYSKYEVVGKTLLDQFFDAGEAERFRENLYGEGYGGKHSLFLYETTLLTKTGSEIPVQLSATVLFEEGEEMGIVAFFQDLRQIRRLEQEKDRMKKMFITMVSHELKTPLVTTMRYFEVLLRGIAGEVAPLQKEILQRMQIRTQGLLTLIRDWLNMAQIEKGKLSQKFEKLDLASIISETVDFMRQQAETQNIMLNIQVPGALPMIQGDKQTLKQVFINLIANAIQYNRNGGAVTVVAREESSNVEVEVSDTGIGISEKDLPFIFDDFYRVKAKETEGTGLGLSITKKIIEANSGTISVSSELGKGSAFVVSLPKIEK